MREGVLNTATPSSYGNQANYQQYSGTSYNNQSRFYNNYIGNGLGSAGGATGGAQQSSYYGASRYGQAQQPQQYLAGPSSGSSTSYAKLSGYSMNNSHGHSGAPQNRYGAAPTSQSYKRGFY